MGKIRKLIENELIGGSSSNELYPVTSTKAVYNTSNESLDAILTEDTKEYKVYNAYLTKKPTIYKNTVTFQADTGLYIASSSGGLLAVNYKISEGVEKSFTLENNSYLAFDLINKELVVSAQGAKNKRYIVLYSYLNYMSGGLLMNYVYNDKFTSLEEKIVSENTIINVDSLYPLEEGYYTSAMARSVVKSIYRKKGAYITYKISAEENITEQFTGDNVSQWGYSQYWKRIEDSLFRYVQYKTDMQTTRLLVEPVYRKTGMILSYVGAQRIAEQYKGTSFDDESFKNDNNWVKLAYLDSVIGYDKTNSTYDIYFQNKPTIEKNGNDYFKVTISPGTFRILNRYGYLVGSGNLTEPFSYSGTRTSIIVYDLDDRTIKTRGIGDATLSNAIILLCYYNSYFTGLMAPYYYDKTIESKIGSSALDSYVKTETLNTALGNKVDSSVFNSSIETLNSKDEELEQSISKLEGQLTGGIEEAVKNWLEENPDATTTVADGSITDVKLSNKTRLKKLNVYNSVAEMVADTELIVGSTAKTLGYYNYNDGGGGEYTIIDEGVENGGDTIALKNGLYASLIYDKKTFRLKQWGIDGSQKIRPAMGTGGIYKFLTLEEMQKVNPKFDSNTTAETYIIQYIINNYTLNTENAKANKYKLEIILDGVNYYLTETIILYSCVYIRGVRIPVIDWLSERTEKPGNGSNEWAYTDSVLMMVKAGIDMFTFPLAKDGTKRSVQNVRLENFSAIGTYGKKGFEGATPGDFIKNENAKLSHIDFYNLTIYGFKNAIKKICDMYWVNFMRLKIRHMKENGIDLRYGSFGSESLRLYANICKVFDCEISAIGVPENTDDSFISEVSRPTLDFGNAIIISGSGNLVENNDLTRCIVGVYEMSYSQATVVLGTYSERVFLAQVYKDYAEGDEANSDSVEIGGYLPKSEDDEGTIGYSNAKKIAYITDF